VGGGGNNAGRGVSCAISGLSRKGGRWRWGLPWLAAVGRVSEASVEDTKYMTAPLGELLG